MDAFLIELIDELIACLRAITTADGYNYELSDTVDRVKGGDGGITMGDVPFVLLGGFSADPTHGPGATLSEYDDTFTIVWWAYAGAESEDPLDRIKAAIRLANDVITKIQRQHRGRLSPAIGSCTRVLPRLLDVFGDGADVPSGCGVAYGSITIQTNREEGI